MKSLKINKPRILLIGAGHFGKHHFNNLKQLDKEGKIDFVGAVVKSEKSNNIQNNTGINFYFDLTDSLLSEVDAVDIVTPPSTHTELTKKCLNFTNVFLEKPITLSTAEGLQLDKISKEKNKILFLGHIYRFHPAIIKLKEILKNSDSKPSQIECVFGDKPDKVTQDCGILYSDLHGFDIIDYLFDEEPQTIFSSGSKMREDSKFEDEVITDLDYKSGLKGIVKLSWNTSLKVRSIKIIFSDKIIKVNLITQEIFVQKNDDVDEEIVIAKEMPLMAELNKFVDVLMGNDEKYPNAIVGTRIVNIASYAERSLREHKKVNYKKI